VGSRHDDGVDVTAARDLLGVTVDSPWPEVRAAYLRLVREHHPDVAADDADVAMQTVRTAQITSAYSTLLAERPEIPDAPPPSFEPKVAASSWEDVLDGSRRVLLAAGMDDAYSALLEVAHMIGVVSYMDRYSAVLETIITAAPGEATSLLIFLEPGPEDGVTEAFLGVEPLGGHAPAPLDEIVDEVARLLARERPPVPDQ
jgi:hypothetical protein